MEGSRVEVFRERARKRLPKAGEGGRHPGLGVWAMEAIHARAQRTRLQGQEAGLRPKPRSGRVRGLMTACCSSGTAVSWCYWGAGCVSQLGSSSALFLPNGRLETEVLKP